MRKVSSILSISFLFFSKVDLDNTKRGEGRHEEVF